MFFIFDAKVVFFSNIIKFAVIKLFNMIIDSIKAFDKYADLHQNFSKVAEFLKTNDLYALQGGNHVIEANNIWCTVETIDKEASQDEELPKLEARDSFIEIHIILDGVEVMGLKNRIQCDSDSANYDEAKDIVTFEDDAENFISCSAGNLMICFPTEAYASFMLEGKLTKLVFKVRI